LFLALAGGGSAVGYALYARSQTVDESKLAMTNEVTKGTLVVSVVEDGNLESASNVDLKCRVEGGGGGGGQGGGTMILWIVPDGTEVKKDQLLVTLDSASIDESIDQQKMTISDADAALIAAEKDWSAAGIAVEEYKEGTYKQTLEQMEADITQAKQNLSSAENTLAFTKKMHRQGYATSLELESKQSLVLQAKLNLGVAMTKKTVLVEYTSKKTLEELASKRDSFEAKLTAQKINHELQVKKLQRLERNKAACTITAPQDGMVVYANDAGGGGRGMQQQVKVEEGASVRQSQAIIRLPDLTKMQVKALVNESKVELLRPGMRANIKVQDRDYQGTVKQVATQPEAGNWFSSGVKEYATIVTIDGQPEGLKPGMTAEVEILVAEKKDVLSIPVQAVVEQGNKFYVWVKTSSKPQRRPVVLGSTNDSFIEIKDGLTEGDLVLSNPRAVVADAREDVPQQETVDVSKKFGATASTVQAPDADTPKAPVKGDPAAAQAAASGGSTAGGPASGGSAAAGAPAGGAGQPTFKDLDKDSDGKLTKEELPESARQWFDMMDADKNGFVDEKEHTAAQERAKQWQGGGGGGGPGGGRGGPGGGGGQGGRGAGGWKLPTFKELDKDGDDKVSEEEMPERMRRNFSDLDKNSDGSLDRKEFKEWSDQVQEMMKRFREQGGAGGFGGGGGGGPPQ
jgi:multidrug resistance efflux pump/Ca2+-binding EF-hand superfamily protein